MSTDWIFAALGEQALARSTSMVGLQLLSSISTTQPGAPDEAFRFVAETLEFAVFDLLSEPEQADELRIRASQAFEHLRAVPTEDPTRLLYTACYGVIGERTPDVARLLRSINFENPDVRAAAWPTRVRAVVVDVWLRLLRKSGWADLDRVLESIVELRGVQEEHEAEFLNGSPASNARAYAWELIASYHLARAAEILATYSSQGEVDGTFDIREQLQAQFDRGVTACERAELVDLFSFVKLLSATAERMVSNSIWTVTRAVNSRVTTFVNALVDRAHARPVFEMLPPQRVTLREHGLLGSSHRAVVVSLPTSSGKTFIAQFRILQALNQFDMERGWVAYIAPTRALVNQVTARLRRDFEPLKVIVERISPALEIDGIEQDLLTEVDQKLQFRVLVTTPEKLDLLLRGGWEAKIGRPLTLVVVDEAHTISGKSRGLRLELLLATINRECRHSQFLLLTPFIDNRVEVARWLSPDSSQAIGIAFHWQPNDRAIMIAEPDRKGSTSDAIVHLRTVLTTRNTIDIPDSIVVAEGRPLGLTFSKIRNSLSNVAAVTAASLAKRGSIILVAQKIPGTWSMARLLEANMPVLPTHPDIELVCSYVAAEFGHDFELIPFLRKGIGLHHAGLSDEIRSLIEWLVEREHLKILVATTTIAQGVNFPVSAVVMASHQYPYGEDVPPEDFWNLAGRVGRADQAGVGIVALAANSPERAAALRTYIQRSTRELNSTLLAMVDSIVGTGNALELNRLFHMKEWSAFLQYLAHTYRQINNPNTFASQVEQVLRGSFGYQKLRRTRPSVANILVSAVQTYALGLRGQPLALVDATGFSWESVSIALRGVSAAAITSETWRPETLFDGGGDELRRAFGVLFEIPEIREELKDVIGGRGGDGELLAKVVKDWVHGASLPEIAENYFLADKDVTNTNAITKACRSIYGKLIQTASWGLSALQALTLGDSLEKASEAQKRTIRNLPSRVFYGVNSDEAISLRLMGVPRNAAQPLANALARQGVTGFAATRTALRGLSERGWQDAVGSNGATYRRAWRVLEGRE